MLLGTGEDLQKIIARIVNFKKLRELESFLELFGSCKPGTGGSY
jgi:hypothetical protein